MTREQFRDAVNVAPRIYVVVRCIGTADDVDSGYPAECCCARTFEITRAEADRMVADQHWSHVVAELDAGDLYIG